MKQSVITALTQAIELSEAILKAKTVEINPTFKTHIERWKTILESITVNPTDDLHEKLLDCFKLPVLTVPEAEEIVDNIRLVMESNNITPVIRASELNKAFETGLNIGLKSAAMPVTVDELTDFIENVPSSTDCGDDFEASEIAQAIIDRFNISHNQSIDKNSMVSEAALADVMKGIREQWLRTYGLDNKENVDNFMARAILSKFPNLQFSNDTE